MNAPQELTPREIEGWKARMQGLTRSQDPYYSYYSPSEASKDASREWQHGWTMADYATKKSAWMRQLESIAEDGPEVALGADMMNSLKRWGFGRSMAFQLTSILLATLRGSQDPIRETPPAGDPSQEPR